MDNTTFIGNYLYGVKFYDFFFPPKFIYWTFSGKKNMQIEYILFQTLIDWI